MEKTFGKKNQDGIIAKIASTHFKKSTKVMEWDKVTLQKIWTIILLCKFDPERNPALVQALLDTGDTKLVEFHRSSTNDSFWSAKVTPEGKIIGNNFMGKMLMRVRKYMKKKLVK